MKDRAEKISQFILENVEQHSSSIVMLLSKEFSFSRQTAHKYVVREVKKKNLIRMGVKSGTRYFLVGGKHIQFNIKVGKDITDEDKIWGKYIKPMTFNYPDNIRGICAYAFTEIFNNAIDHSGASTIYTDFEVKDGNISIDVIDNGIGIFQKIQNALNLEYKREAILHLAKGKFTTDPSKHTGEGIFFSSRMLDSFSISSDDLFYTFRQHDWFLSPEKEQPEKFGKGTLIRMTLSLNSKTKGKEVLDKYSDENYGFSKTIIAVALSADPGDPHVSRSQAKRLLIGLEKFKSIVLDFKGVESVGQAFVDQVFRVFKNEHPEIQISYFNANPEVEAMIKRGADGITE